MKTNNYIVKTLVVVVTAVFIFMALTVYFAWSDSHHRKELVTTQNELTLTQEELTSIQNDYQAEIEKSILLNEELDSVNAKLEEANTTIANLKDGKYKLVYIGDFKITHYCTEKRKHICGTGDGLTATGTQVTAGRTIAVDPKVIPYGTKMYIEGYGWRVAEDCGGAVKGNHIDMAVDTHSQAMSMGIKTGGVWVLIKTP